MSHLICDPVFNWFMYGGAQRLSSSIRLVLLCLANVADTQGYAKISMERIHVATGLARTTIVSALNLILEAPNTFVSVYEHGRPGKATVYYMDGVQLEALAAEAKKTWKAMNARCPGTGHSMNARRVLDR